MPLTVIDCKQQTECRILCVWLTSPVFLALPCCTDAKDNSFTRSRSSSVTSIDRESREAISAFHFCESFPRKNDGQPGPCLLVGTTQGSVMMVALSLPPGGDQRLQQPVAISSCGKTATVFRPCKLCFACFMQCDVIDMK